MSRHEGTTVAAVRIYRWAVPKRSTGSSVAVASRGGHRTVLGVAVDTPGLRAAAGPVPSVVGCGPSS
jgi:hypothetical protein